MSEPLKSSAELEFEFALANCAKEPIHIPGAIQPHGILMRLSEPDLIVTHVSDNCETLLGLTADELLHRPFSEILDQASAAGVLTNLLSPNLERHNPQKVSLVKIGGMQQAFDCAAHRFKNNLIVELEPTAVMKPIEFSNFYHLARISVQKLRRSFDLKALFASTVEEIRSVTGFDRVVIYKFDVDWNGHVVAESATTEVESYFDLRFPASDIPKQVRDLFLINRLRVIPSSKFKPSRILPSAFVTETGEPMDLSFASLRNVSPIHIEYLKNMNVTASMSISLLVNGKLWGLISCSHEAGPLLLPYDVRAVCDFLGETLSSLIPVHETTEDLGLQSKLALIHNKLLAQMTESNPFVDGLLVNPELFLELGGATSGAIYINGDWFAVGPAPEPAVLEKLRSLVQDNANDETFFATSLPHNFEGAEALKKSVCGIAAFATSKAFSNFFFWFKPEVIQTVNWGRNPNKSVTVDGDRLVLHPRKSFELWKETVRLQSLPWKQEERRAIQQLRMSIVEIVLQKIGRITRLNTDLERSNSELDSFAYAASHDLKEPLRGIHNYAKIIMRDSAGELSADSQERLATILRLTQRSEDLINSLLDYSQIGRSQLIAQNADLNQAVVNAIDSQQTRIDESCTQVVVHDLPTVEGDRVQIIEVFTNLISNGIKYNSAPQPLVEIGTAGYDQSTGFPILFVKDNGIGIDRAHHELIFKIFKRLHGKSKFGGGTGTGLTIAQKIIERHGGRIWIDSEINQGSTFYFTLGKSILK